MSIRKRTLLFLTAIVIMELAMLSMTDRRIILGHILPNGIGAVIVEVTLQLGYAIIQESGLSFLGFGIQQPTPSWGNLISSAQDHSIKYPGWQSSPA